MESCDRIVFVDPILQGHTTFEHTLRDAVGIIGILVRKSVSHLGEVVRIFRIDTRNHHKRHHRIDSLVGGEQSTCYGFSRIHCINWQSVLQATTASEISVCHHLIGGTDAFEELDSLTDNPTRVMPGKMELGVVVLHDIELINLVRTRNFTVLVPMERDDRRKSANLAIDDNLGKPDDTIIFHLASKDRCVVGLVKTLRILCDTYIHLSHLVVEIRMGLIDADIDSRIVPHVDDVLLDLFTRAEVDLVIGIRERPENIWEQNITIEYLIAG